MAVTPRYFYLNGDAHRRLRVVRAHDRLTAWNYKEGKMVDYSLTDARRNMKRAFSTPQVAEMINRVQTTLLHALMDGNIQGPQLTYSIDEHRRPHMYLWDEKHILMAHDYFSSVHKGRVRNDGKITPQELPTRRELKAMINQETVLYVKTNAGEFVPTFMAEVY